MLQAAKEARKTFWTSEEYQVADNKKYKKLLCDTMAAISHWFLREYPEVVWDTNSIWDAVEFWSDDDINSEYVPSPEAPTVPSTSIAAGTAEDEEGGQDGEQQDGEEQPDGEDGQRDDGGEQQD
ncbi:unnamed protein product [Linum trigynum]|uniref:Uncharacterized protein n=1 Tax=Linum trigynum TaxID=586398 RepID=A0AAV2EEE9_9ROSI